MIAKLLKDVGDPTLVISHLSTGHVALSSFLEVAGAAVASLTVFAVASGFFLKPIGHHLRAFIAPMSLNDVGNSGLPVAAFAIADPGLAHAFAFVVVLLGVSTNSPP